MAITTYAELQTAVGNWLGRSDLTSRIPEFIVLAEADMRRQLRDKKTVAALTLDAGVATKALGSSVKYLVSLRYNDGVRSYPLRQMSMAALANIRVIGSGVPQAFAIVDGTAYFDVTPDSAYVMQMEYVEKISAIASGTNTTLTNSPDIYLFGALKEAGPYLEHDERVALWEQKYQHAVDQENIARERAEYNGVAEQGSPVVFGTLE